MIPAIERLSAGNQLVAMAERASPYALLQQALRRQRHIQELPAHLYGDLGLPPQRFRDWR